MERVMTGQDIIEELNRMSSAVHIIMCKYLAKNPESGDVHEAVY